MAKQTIDTGVSANDGTGDTLRAAAGKINDNFDELYLAKDFGSNLVLINSNIYVVDIRENGTHTGTDNSTTLTDSSQGTWVANEYAGYYLINKTDQSIGIIATNGTDSVDTFSTAMTGGTDNDFDVDDVYIICKILAKVASNGDITITGNIKTEASPSELI
jgi:hypothetical protein